MFPRHRRAVPVFMPFMEAAGIEPAQDSPGRCVLCPSSPEHKAELSDGVVFDVCGPCLTGTARQWVYFIRGGGHVKIGYSRDPVARLRTHQIGSPVPLVLAYVFEGQQPIERLFHREAKAYRAHGEWFVDCPELWATFSSAGFQRELRDKQREVEERDRERRIKKLLEAA